ncbi:MAG: bifunctional proline dehydrogenase/L-glutamate gamma-semialdehyde dehydrogenase [Myxococcales bacterium]
MARAAHYPPLDEARRLLDAGAGRACSRKERAELAERLAATLLAASRWFQGESDRARARSLGRLMRDPAGLTFTTQLTDRAYRSDKSARVAQELRQLVGRYGVPRYLDAWERVQLFAASQLAGVLPGVVVAGTRGRIREETRDLLLSAHPEAVRALLGVRHREHTRVNLNQLGEALLGERAAEERVEKYCAIARELPVDALSVKVSSIGSQLQPLAFDDCVSTLSARLARIYRASLERAGGPPVVMLDMEAYRHAELTLAVLERALESRELDAVRAGVVLQAYLPDSGAWQRALTQWAARRCRQGGAALRLRIVKGANLAAERVESAKGGVAVPIFERKVEVDANYKQLLEQAVSEGALAAVTLGVASHNLFDVAYALLLAREHDAGASVGIEMLEGMADPLRRTLTALGVDVLVYAPVCDDDDLNTGIAYLVRRLEENTSGDNFLSASFGMQPHDEGFERERRRFRASIEAMDQVEERPRRKGEPSFDRTCERFSARAQGEPDFRNEPDTDFSRAANRAWVASALTRTRELSGKRIGSLIDGQRHDRGVLRAGVDPSRPGVTLYEVALADAASVEAALHCAAEDRLGFSASSARSRSALLRNVAQALRSARGELIGLMVADAGKRVGEADVEVSEAVDFAEYYRLSFLRLLREVPEQVVPRGVVVVTPPWNFPLAIPAGGVLAALMAGNRVILKPALETALIATRLVELMHAAGVPREALQLVLCDDDAGSALIRDARVDAVILTGATDTARLFQRLKPGLHLLAETGGKNAYIVSAMSDRDQAIADAVYSAFGHAGQKCSAASLLILEAEVHDDPRFLATLKDAVQSLPVDAAWEPRSFVTPLIHPPAGPLLRAIEQLEPGESWLVEPRITPENPRLVTPGVKLGVQAGSFTHRTELFGPVLAVMRARDLPDAISLANATGYGLTAGLASLDEREQALFVRTIAAGNIYVNRTTTGAVVQRQPFGGLGKSGFGPGAKAGGPNYVMQLCRVQASPGESARAIPLANEFLPWLLPYRPLLAAAQFARLRDRLADYAQAWQQHFTLLHDPSRVLGQDNYFRYLPELNMYLRVEATASLVDVAASALAARLAGAQLTLSMSPSFAGPLDSSLFGFPVQLGETPSLRRLLHEGSRVRLVGARTPEHDALAAEFGVHIADAPVLDSGRLELLHYVREQSVSVEYHRYGQIPRARCAVVQPWK